MRGWPALRQRAAAALAACATAGALVLGTTRPSGAMTLERVGTDLYATGPIVGTDPAAFQAEIARGGLRRVILVNSFGGELRAALQVALMVRDAKLDTLVSGQCHSSCSLIFMAGRERRFATGSKARSTLVGIHGPNHRHTREPTPEAARLMDRFYRERMGARYNEAIIGQALYAITEHNGMLRLRELGRTTPEERVPWFCPSAQTPDAACIRHHGQDAYTLGVITHLETVPITLPPSMRLALEYFGLRLDEAGDPLPARLSEISGATCRAVLTCVRGFDEAGTRWLASDHHRAAAVGIGKPGYVFSRNADSPWQAMLQALYACNHMRDNPRLCRLVAVDDRTVPDIGAAVATRSRALLAALPAPDARAVEAEGAEPGPEMPWTYRKTDVRGPTPVALEGVQRLDTGELARLLTRPQPPLLIDVSGSDNVMLPSALHFVHGGLAFRDIPTENAYEQRFLAMLRAAGAQHGSEIVFYAADSSSWQSVNAAMRAQRNGYTRVGWYRGGLAAWRAAGLPTVQKTAVAVLR